MAWQSEPDEQVQQDWQVRSAKKREELSLSIEETLTDDALIEDPFSDEVDEAFQDSKSSIIIPPRLSLQSKPLPVVHIESKEVTNITSQTITDSVAVPQTAQNKRRLAGRTTRVHLQAVPKSEKKSGGKISIEKEKIVRSADGEAQSGVKNSAKRSSKSGDRRLVEGRVKSSAQASLAGSDIFKQGQREMMVANTHISPSSVVVVTLVGDPGPVVVKYISLQPQIGFTVHLSAQAEAETPFNYVVLMWEVF